MQLSPKAIDEFKAIYHEDYGIALSDDQAAELATSFFNLMRAICRPLPDEACAPETDVLY